MVLLCVLVQGTGWYPEYVTEKSNLLTLPYYVVIYKLQNTSHEVSRKFQVLLGHIHNDQEPHTLPVD